MTSEPSPGLAFEESEQSTVAYPESDDDDVDLALELERLGSPACAALAASPLVWPLHYVCYAAGASHA